MNIHSTRAALSRACGALVLLTVAAPLAASDHVKLRAGSLACGGNHFVRLSGSEEHRSSYSFRNLAALGSIALTRIVVFDADGGILYEFPEQPLPPEAKAVLEPHQSTQINTRDILPADLGPTERPIQLHVDWAYLPRSRGLALAGTVVRTVRDAGNGTERSRANSECKLVALRR